MIGVETAVAAARVAVSSAIRSAIRRGLAQMPEQAQGVTTMTRTDRRRFPVLFAAIAALALAGAALGLLLSPLQAQEGSVPASPTGLTAEVSHDSVILSWDDPGDDTITGYQVLRSDLNSTLRLSRDRGERRLGDDDDLHGCHGGARAGLHLQGKGGECAWRVLRLERRAREHACRSDQGDARRGALQRRQPRRAEPLRGWNSTPPSPATCTNTALPRRPTWRRPTSPPRRTIAMRMWRRRPVTRAIPRWTSSQGTPTRQPRGTRWRSARARPPSL